MTAFFARARLVRQSHPLVVLATLALLLARARGSTGAAEANRSPEEPFEQPTIRLRSAAVAAAEAHLETAREADRAGLVEFLRLQSVSSDPTRTADVRSAADWLVARALAAGLENAVAIPTTTEPTDIAKDEPPANQSTTGVHTATHTHTLALAHPVVYADWLHADSPDAPTVLVYGHYDVQPEDPVDLWTSRPFEPEVRNGNLYARGASDDKGNLLSPILAVEAWLKTNGKLPVNVKILMEGEEEIGSPNLLPFLQKHRDLLMADYVFSADGGQISPEQPGLCLGLRGTVAFQVDVFAGSKDGHSGTFGGGVQNPLHALAHILSSVHSRSDGSIRIPGFYDDVAPLTSEDRLDVGAFASINPEKYTLGTIGVSESFGEDGYSFYERTWARPSVEIVGMWGGYVGDGIKTVLPAAAHAKISARLAPAQDPDKAAFLIESHIRNVSSTIKGIRVEVTREPFTAKPYRASKNGPASRAAAQVLEGVFGKEPVYFYMGGSIPATSYLKDVIGVDTVMFAFGHSDENVHAPDEYARLKSLDQGEIAYVRLFETLALEHATRTFHSNETCPMGAGRASERCKES